MTGWVFDLRRRIFNLVDFLAHGLDLAFHPLDVGHHLLVVELPADLVHADLAFDLGLDVVVVAPQPTNPQAKGSERSRQPRRAENDQRHDGGDKELPEREVEHAAPGVSVRPAFRVDPG